MRYIYYDESKRMIYQRRFGDIEGSYTVGKPLIDFIDIKIDGKIISSLQKVVCMIDERITSGELGPYGNSTDDTKYDIDKDDNFVTTSSFATRLKNIIRGAKQLTDHVYFCFMSEYDSWSGKSWTELRALFSYDYKALQDELSRAILFCLDIDAYPMLQGQQSSFYRYKCADDLTLFPTIKMNKNHIVEWSDDWLTSYYLLPNIENERIELNWEASKLEEILPGNIFSLLKSSYQQPDYKHRFENINPINLLTYEFEMMVKYGLRLRRCSNCDLYFVIEGEYDTHFCKRVQNETKRRTVKKMCIEIGPVRGAEKARKANTIKKQFKNANDRMRLSVRRKKLMDKHYQEWLKEAEKIRDLSVNILNNEIIIDWLRESKSDKFEDRMREATEIISQLNKSDDNKV